MNKDGRVFHIGDYEIDIIVHGFPGKSVCHGALGFSTIAMIGKDDRIALVDVGSFGQRPLLLEQLQIRGLKPSDITDVLLTHSHWDHSVNWPMFKNANIIIGQEELDWSLQEPWGETMVPELYMKELKSWPKLKTVNKGDEVFPGITAHLAPGHTPGCLVYVLDAGDQDIIFSGDACKNRAELVSKDTDMTYDPEVSRKSIETIWKLWTAKPDSILVPGHDLPMVLDNGKPRYLGKSEAAIKCWFGDGMDETTLISLKASS